MDLDETADACAIYPVTGWAMRGGKFEREKLAFKHWVRY